jgi:hypothetical protein
MEPEIQAPTQSSELVNPSQEEHGNRGVAWLTGAAAVGALLIEPELIVGMAIGAAAVAAPKLWPKLAREARPLADSARRALREAVEKGRQLGRHGKEQLRDVVTPTTDPPSDTGQPA